jgi:hypothetical protein
MRLKSVNGRAVFEITSSGGQAMLKLIGIIFFPIGYVVRTIKYRPEIIVEIPEESLPRDDTFGVKYATDAHEGDSLSLHE